MSTPTPEQRLVLTDADLDELQRYVDARDWAGLPFAVDRIAQRVAEEAVARARRAEEAVARVEALAEKWVAWDEGDEFSETRNWDGKVLGSVLRAALNGAEA